MVFFPGRSVVCLISLAPGGISVHQIVYCIRSRAYTACWWGLQTGQRGCRDSFLPSQENHQIKETKKNPLNYVSNFSCTIASKCMIFQPSFLWVVFNYHDCSEVLIYLFSQIYEISSLKEQFSELYFQCHVVLQSVPPTPV